MPLLTDLHIRITSRCNLNCRHCYAADWFQDDASLDLETTLSTIDQARALGCRKVTFTGGEPLVSKVTVPAIKACLDAGLRVEVETNGILIDAILASLDGCVGAVEFAVSYDGDAMRDARFSERVRNNIACLARLGCDVKIQTVLTEINAHEAELFFDFSERLGVRNRVFLAHSPNGNGRDLPLFPLETWLRIVARLRARYQHLIIELPDVFSGGTQKKCGWGVHRCEIMPNGDVTSCGPIAFNRRDYVAGNVKEQPLQAIRDAPHFTSIRRLTQADFEGLCAWCPDRVTCLGACRSIAYATEGTLLSPHPFCVACYDRFERAAPDDPLFDTVPLARDWYVQVRSRQHPPSRATLCDTVERQHLRVY